MYTACAKVSLWGPAHLCWLQWWGAPGSRATWTLRRGFHLRQGALDCDHNSPSHWFESQSSLQQPTKTTISGRLFETETLPNCCGLFDNIASFHRKMQKMTFYQPRQVTQSPSLFHSRQRCILSKRRCTLENRWNLSSIVHFDIDVSSSGIEEHPERTNCFITTQKVTHDCPKMGGQKFGCDFLSAFILMLAFQWERVQECRRQSWGCDRKPQKCSINASILIQKQAILNIFSSENGENAWIRECAMNRDVAGYFTAHEHISVDMVWNLLRRHESDKTSFASKTWDRLQVRTIFHLAPHVSHLNNMFL